jgi:hypothetical protein
MASNKFFLVLTGTETTQIFAAMVILASSLERRTVPYILLFQ